MERGKEKNLPCDPTHCPTCSGATLFSSLSTIFEQCSMPGASRFSPTPCKMLEPLFFERPPELPPWPLFSSSPMHRCAHWQAAPSRAHPLLILTGHTELILGFMYSLHEFGNKFFCFNYCSEFVSYPVQKGNSKNQLQLLQSQNI